MKFSAVTVAAMAISSVLAKDRQYTTEITYTSDGATKTYTSTHKTHKYGKFNNTHHEGSKKPKSTGTHKYGKFNNTHHEGSKKPKSTGTHKYGKFNNTHHEKPTTEVEIKVPENDASGNRMNSMKLFGLTTGTAVVAGALMLL